MRGQRGLGESLRNAGWTSALESKSELKRPSNLILSTLLPTNPAPLATAEFVQLAQLELEVMLWYKNNHTFRPVECGFKIFFLYLR
jgi:hypothetical protein